MMNLTFAPKGVLQIDDARLVFKNFRGEGSKYNREGDRNFAVVIETEDQYSALLADVNKFGDSWNVRVKEPRDEGDTPFMYLPVKVKFNDKGPTVKLIAGRSVTYLSEDSVAILDRVDILQVNIDIRPYDGEVNGKTYRAAYLKGIEVIQDIDRFADVGYDDDLEAE